MNKTFYGHLIEIESIIIELDKLDLSKEQKHHLTSLVDVSLHHTVLDAILSQLKEEDKRVFMHQLTVNDHQKIWKFLNEKVDNIEDRIKNTAEQLKKELLKDIKKSKMEKKEK